MSTFMKNLVSNIYTVAQIYGFSLLGVTLLVSLASFTSQENYLAIAGVQRGMLATAALPLIFLAAMVSIDNWVRAS